MGKEIHCLLSRESWKDLEATKKKSFPKDYKPKSYEEYLKEQEKNPTMAYCA